MTICRFTHLDNIMFVFGTKFLRFCELRYFIAY